MQERVKKPGDRLVRKQVLITADQNRRLKARAGATGIAQSVLVREGLERVLSETNGPAEDWRSELEAFLSSIEPLDAAFEKRIKYGREAQSVQWRARLSRRSGPAGGL